MPLWKKQRFLNQRRRVVRDFSISLDRSANLQSRFNAGFINNNKGNTKRYINREKIHFLILSFVIKFSLILSLIKLTFLCKTPGRFRWTQPPPRSMHLSLPSNTQSNANKSHGMNAFPRTVRKGGKEGIASERENLAGASESPRERCVAARRNARHRMEKFDRPHLPPPLLLHPRSSSAPSSPLRLAANTRLLSPEVDLCESACTFDYRKAQWQALRSNGVIDTSADASDVIAQIPRRSYVASISKIRIIEGVLGEPGAWPDVTELAPSGRRKDSMKKCAKSVIRFTFEPETWRITD